MSTEVQSTAASSLSYQAPGVRTAWWQRINWRLAVFFLAVGLLPGFFVYQYTYQWVTGGITDAGGGYKEVDLKAMSSFYMNQEEATINDIPAKWRELDGQKVVVYGEMWQPMSAGPFVETYQLCYSIAKCCFSGPPQVQHFVDSKALPGKKLEYFSGLVKVKGILHINVKKGGGKVQSVYQMDVESIEPVQ